MPSELIVPVASVDKVREHPNAALLCIAEVLGWQCVVPMREDAEGTITRFFRKGEVDERGRRVPVEVPADFYTDPNASAAFDCEVDVVTFSPVHKEGDVVVYFPPDVMLHRELSDELGVTGYLSFKNDDPDYGRVRCARLRGEPSFGIVIELPEGADWKPGDNVADKYDVKKYEAPVRPDSGDIDRELTLFTTYTDIQNLRNYPFIFKEGEEVVVTEKIHGTNCRVGLVEVGPEVEDDELNAAGGVPEKRLMFVAGSHTHRRKRPEADMERHLYWMPLSMPEVKALLLGVVSGEVPHRQVILYGETYGTKVQGGFNYDAGKGLGFRAFDLYVDGRYLPYDEFKALCQKYGVETVPELGRVSFSMSNVHKLCNLDGKSVIGGHMIEGGVVRPVVERRHPAIGRVVLKYIGDEYLLKNKQDWKDE